MRRRILTAALSAALAAGLVLGTTATALATPIADARYSVVAELTHQTTSANSYCTAVLLSEQLTATDPAYVSGYLQNVQAGAKCLGWLEKSVNGGKTWAISSSIVTTPSAAGFTDWVKLGEQKDGPGLRARVCFQVGTATKAYCTKGVSLKASAATPVGFPVRLGYLRALRVDGTLNASECLAYVSTSTIAKKATTVADGFFVAFAATCTGYEQTSTNGGVTWTTVSRKFVFTSNGTTTIWSFTAVHPDGTGRLARACVELGGGKALCTTAW